MTNYKKHLDALHIFLFALTVFMLLAPRNSAWAMSPDCYIPSPDGADIAEIKALRSYTVSNIAVAGQDRGTGVIRVEIAHESRPLYLVLVAGSPIIWQITGDVARIKNVILAGNERPAGIEAGLTGVAKDKVTFISAGGCINNSSLSTLLRQSDSLRNNGRASKNAKQMYITIPISTEGKRNTGQFMRARVSSSQIILDGLPKTLNANPAPQGIDPAVWSTFLDFVPGGIENLRNLTVVSDIKAEPYVVLPGWAGIVQLVMQGSLVPERSVRSKHSFMSTSHMPIGSSPPNQMRYRIVKDIGWFPNDLTGSTAPQITLAKGVPLPKGDFGHVCIKSEETGQPVAGTCMYRIMSPEAVQAFHQRQREASITQETQPRVKKGPPLPDNILQAIHYAVQAYPEPTSSSAAQSPVATATITQNPTPGVDRLIAWSDSAPSPIWFVNIQKALGDISAVKEITRSQPSCALKQDGTVSCWTTEPTNCNQGYGNSTECRDTTKPLDIRMVQIESLPPMQSITQKCSPDRQGKTWCWRENMQAFPYQPHWVKAYPDNKDFTKLAASFTTFSFGMDDQECGITSTGDVWCWGPLYSNRDTFTRPDEIKMPLYPVLIKLPLPALSLSLSQSSCAMLQNNTAWCWKQSMEPIAYSLLKSSDALLQVSTSQDGICVIKRYDGSVWCTNSMSSLERGATLVPLETAPNTPLKNMTWISGRRDSCGIDVQKQLWCWRNKTEQNLAYAEQVMIPGTKTPMTNVRSLSVDRSGVTLIFRSEAIASIPTTPVVAISPPSPHMPQSAQKITALNSLSVNADTIAHGIKWQQSCPKNPQDAKELFKYYPVIAKGSLHKDGFNIDKIYKGYRNQRLRFDSAEVVKLDVPQNEPLLIAAAFDGERVRLDACSKVYVLKDADKQPIIMDMLAEAIIYDKQLSIQPNPDYSVKPPATAITIGQESDMQETFSLQRQAYLAKSNTLRDKHDYLQLIETSAQAIQNYLSSVTISPSAIPQNEYPEDTDMLATCAKDTNILANYLSPHLIEKFAAPNLFNLSYNRLHLETDPSFPGYDLVAPLDDLTFALIQLGDYRATLHLLQCKVQMPKYLIALSKGLAIPELLKDLKPGSSIDLSDTDVSGLSLKGLNANHITWKNVSVNGTDFTKASFVSTKFQNVDFTQAKLDFATYNCSTNFDPALDPVARHMVLLGENRPCDGKPFMGSNLNGLDATSTCVGPCPAVFAYVGEKIEKMTARGSILGIATCTRCSIKNSDFSKAVITLNLTATVISNTAFVGAQLKNSIWNDTKFINVDFTGADLSGLSLNNSSYDSKTKWPAGFDPTAAGMQKIEGQ